MARKNPWGLGAGRSNLVLDQVILESRARAASPVNAGAKRPKRPNTGNCDRTAQWPRMMRAWLGSGTV